MTQPPTRSPWAWLWSAPRTPREVLLSAVTGFVGLSVVLLIAGRSPGSAFVSGAGFGVAVLVIGLLALRWLGWVNRRSPGRPE